MSLESNEFSLNLHKKSKVGRVFTVHYASTELFQLGVTRARPQYATAVWNTDLSLQDSLAEMVASFVRMRRYYQIPEIFDGWQAIKNGNPIAEPCSVKFLTELGFGNEAIFAVSPYLDQGEKLEDLPNQYATAGLPQPLKRIFMETPYNNYILEPAKDSGNRVTMFAGYDTPRELARLFFATTSLAVPKDVNSLGEILAGPMQDMRKLNLLF